MSFTLSTEDLKKTLRKKEELSNHNDSKALARITLERSPVTKMLSHRLDKHVSIGLIITDPAFRHGKWIGSAVLEQTMLCFLFVA